MKSAIMGRFWAVSVSLVLLTPVVAEDWRSIPEDSVLRFSSAYDGDAFSGAFEQFRVRMNFDPDQPDTAELRVEVDSDFAGCSRPRKSTAGFVALLGAHCISTKCKHQSVIALSSGEAEFYGLTSGLARGMGLQQMIRDWSWEVDLCVASDSTTAITMATRHGHGRAKHMAVQYLWSQSIFNSGQARNLKVGTDVNRADLMTKHLP